MRSIVVACLIVVLTMNSARAQTPQGAPALPATPLRSQLTSDVIKDAVKETLASDKQQQKQSHAVVLGAEKYESFTRDFSEAKVPDCLHADGLKRQPTFFLGGLLALPFVLVAAVRGKCH
jgi:negative regulator of sigma E activity